MADCIPLTRAMLKDPIDIVVPEAPLDFSQARALADRRARAAGAEPMLLAWYNAETGEFSPRVTCCRDDKPAWLTYAETRGGDLIVSINQEAFVFVYLRTP